MDFKGLTQHKLFFPGVVVLLVVLVLLGKSLFKSNTESQEVPGNVTTPPVLLAKDTVAKAPVQGMASNKAVIKKTELGSSGEDDAAIQDQLDHDREAQKKTKYLKTQLEQTNLELEQEKAFAEINKLKIDNMGAFKDPTEESQKNFPEIKVDYIGGSAVKKEAILSIAGTDYQVKEKSKPTDNIQVVSISDSSVTLHFTAPQDLTKIIDYKPE